MTTTVNQKHIFYKLFIVFGIAKYIKQFKKKFYIFCIKINKIFFLSVIDLTIV